MLNAAAEAGLEFLGVTDHNNVAHQLAYGPGGDGLPIVLPGVEVTTYGGHWNAWGTDRWWEFREPESNAVERTMRAAMASGAVVSICHPKPFGPPWEYSNEGGFNAIEVWNGPWAQLNSASLARWDGLLRRGVRCAAVGGSDTHYLHRRDAAPRHADSIGTPTTWVHVAGAPSAATIRPSSSRSTGVCGRAGSRRTRRSRSPSARANGCCAPRSTSAPRGTASSSSCTTTGSIA